MKKLILLCLITSINFAQKKEAFFNATAIQTGYANIGKNFAYVCLEKRIDEGKNWFFVNVGAGSYISYFDNKIQFVPEFHVNATMAILMGQLAVTKMGFEPSIGLNISNYIQLKVGYNYSFAPQYFKGTTFGININFGDKDYHYMAPMKIIQ